MFKVNKGDFFLRLPNRATFGENIIATIKMRNNFCNPLKMVFFQYCDSKYKVKTKVIVNYKYIICQKKKNSI